ncbi:hypothetical protein [Nocardia sp. NPDC019395]
MRSITRYLPRPQIWHNRGLLERIAAVRRRNSTDGIWPDQVTFEY